jgi:CCR4-NOT transcriptional regulation complex NOT5 subunit
MVPGNVYVDDNGTEAYTPDDGTNSAKALYLLLIQNQSQDTTPTTTITQPTVTVDANFNITVVDPGSVTTVETPIPASPQIKKALASQANMYATWLFQVFTGLQVDGYVMYTSP